MKFTFERRAAGGIRLRLSGQSAKAYLSTRIVLSESDWNGAKGEVKRRADRGELNQQLTALLERARATYADQIRKGLNPTPAELVDLIRTPRIGSIMLADFIQTESVHSEHADRTRAKVSVLIGHIRSWPKQPTVAAFTYTKLKDLERYLGSLDSLRGGKLKPSTVRSYLALLAPFLKEAYRRNLIETDPFHAWTMKAPSDRYRFLTEFELDQIKSIPTERLSPDLIETRDAFLFDCATGLRIGDLMRLKASDIKGMRLIYTPEKTSRHKRPATVDLPLDEMLGGEAGRIVAPRLGRTGQLFDLPSYTTARTRLTVLAAIAGLDEVSWHVARHTFATRLLTRGVDLKSVSVAMGHKSIATTERYARVLQGALDQALRRSM